MLVIQPPLKLCYGLCGGDGDGQKALEQHAETWVQANVPEMEQCRLHFSQGLK